MSTVDTATKTSAPSKAATGDEASPTAKKSRKKLIVIVVVLLVVVAGGVYESGMLGKQKPKAAAVVVTPGPVVSLPQLTTNLSDGHLVQLSLAAQLAPGQKSTAVKASVPRIENLMLSIYSRYSYSQLLDDAGRTRAADEVLQGMRKILGATKANPIVSAVYYTSFVMQ